MSTQHNESDPFQNQGGEEEPGYVPGDLSLAEEIDALIQDGKTYLQAELSYQKTRAAFVADQTKAATIFSLIAAVFGSLALIGLTVGLTLALTPWLTAWGASALVVGLLALGAILFARAALKRWRKLTDAIQPDSEPRP